MHQRPSPAVLDPIQAAGWRPGSNPPVLDIHRPDPTRAFRVHIGGMEHSLPVGPVHGTLAVHANPDGSREIRCPGCGDGSDIVNQEWVYSSRRVVAPTLTRVDDPAAGNTRWFLTVSTEPEEDDGANDVADALAAPFFCRSCGNGYTLPDGVDLDLAWG